MSEPFDQGSRSKSEQMNYLRIRSIIPVDLNSILYRCHKLMAHMYDAASTNESPSASAFSKRHEDLADKLREAVLALHWDPKNLAFFDFVLDKEEQGKNNTGKIHRFWSGASVFPYWAEIWPKALDCQSSRSKKDLMRAFSGVRDILEM
jgi:alpha,alpha-trehalase